MFTEEKMITFLKLLETLFKCCLYLLYYKYKLHKIYCFKISSCPLNMKALFNRRKLSRKFIKSSS